MVSLFASVAPVLGDWEAVGHRLEGHWLDDSARYGPWLFVALLTLVVSRALWRQRRYRAVGALGTAERAALAERVAAFEAQTDGEIVVVVVEASDRHPDAPWKCALALCAAGTLTLAGTVAAYGPLGFVALQTVLIALGYGLAEALPDLRRGFVRELRATEVADEQALQELQRLEITSHPQRSAVLLFVSLFEQRVVVLADEAAHAAAGEGAWLTADRAVLDGLRAGGLVAALERGIDALGAVLAEALPATGAKPGRHRDEPEVRRR